MSNCPFCSASYLIAYLNGINVFSTRMCHLVSGFDVAFRLYQHLDDLRVPPGRCPVNRRTTILNNHHFVSVTLQSMLNYRDDSLETRLVRPSCE